MNPKEKEDEILRLHFRGKFVIENGMYAIGFWVWTNTGYKRFWGLTGGDQERVKAVIAKFSQDK